VRKAAFDSWHLAESQELVADFYGLIAAKIAPQGRTTADPDAGLGANGQRARAQQA